MTQRLRCCFIVRYNAFNHIANVMGLDFIPLQRYFMETCTLPELILHTDELIELIENRLSSEIPARSYG